MRNFLNYFVASILLFSFVQVEAKQKYYVRMADSEIKRNPESWMVDFSPKLKWDYCHGLELQSIFDVWKKTGNKKYFEYVNSYADTIIDNNGKIFGYKQLDYNIDRVNPGKMLFQLYGDTKTEKYLQSIEILRDQMKTHPRTSEGGFWHKKIYPNQMWLDGLYMASPFLAEYAYKMNEPALYDDVANQIILMAKHGSDVRTGLYYHAWDESKEQRWANKVTGQSPNFWSRSMGWYMMAIVDVLEFLPENHPKRPEIIRILKDFSVALEKFQDKKSGMWYQVTDMGGKEGNYLESSASAMFIYSWVKAGQNGYLPKTFLCKGKKAYLNYIKQFVVENSDGTISITNACSVAGLGGSPNYRDGSYNYYISEPKRDNDAKAVGPFIMVSVLLNK
ncbi:MAG: glycoside hydrolase family 88 protein [Paludibacter sp.]|nr:glycoside hydrolase family 88 protein [Paludibacter sp.]